VLARPGTFKPLYHTGTELARESWPRDGWVHGGAPVWGWLSYDPALDLVYYGTGNPAPYNAERRLGDNRWATSVVARTPGDGSLLWAYQFTPADNWDYDSTQEMILTELTIAGRGRKVLVHFDKNGFVYVLDRATGELLSAEPYVPLNWAKRVDLRTGRPEVDSTKLTGASRGKATEICPARGRQEPAARRLLTRHRALLRSHEQSLHGLPDHGRLLRRGHAVPRRQRALSPWPGWSPRRVQKASPSAAIRRPRPSSATP
jgi:hypothetical protein